MIDVVAKTDSMLFDPADKHKERKSFRCICFCNVFRRVLPDDKGGIKRYKCNSCGMIWRGTRP